MNEAREETTKEAIEESEDTEKASLLAWASKFPTATLHEAGGRIGALPSAIKPLSPAFKVCGWALPVQSPPLDNLWLHRAIYEATPGAVLVVHTSNYYEAGYWGEIMTQAAQTRHLGGLVIDGGVRDSARLIELGFPIFSRGVCIRGTSKNPQGEGWLNQPIQFNDVQVTPGDLVVGDADGVVVIPMGAVADVLAKAQTREEAEAKIIAQLLKGGSTLDIYQLP